MAGREGGCRVTGGGGGCALLHIVVVDCNEPIDSLPLCVCVGGGGIKLTFYCFW